MLLSCCCIAFARLPIKTFLLQNQLAVSRDIVMNNGGLPGAGSVMGDRHDERVRGSFEEAFDTHLQSSEDWPETADGKLRLVFCTLANLLGCRGSGKPLRNTDDHSSSLIVVTPAQSARLRGPAIFVVPHGSPMYNIARQKWLMYLFVGGSCIDFPSPPGPLRSALRAGLFRPSFLHGNSCRWGFRRFFPRLQ